MHQSVAIRHTIMITLVSHSHVSLYNVSLESPTQPAEDAFRPGPCVPRVLRLRVLGPLVHARRRPRSAPCAGVRVSAREPEHDARRRVLQRTCDVLQ